MLPPETPPIIEPIPFLQRLEEMDFSELSPDIVIKGQSLIIKCLKSMIHKKLPDVLKQTIEMMNTYAKDSDMIVAPQQSQPSGLYISYYFIRIFVQCFPFYFDWFSKIWVVISNK